MALGVDRLDNRVRRRRQEAVDEVRTDLVPRSPLNSVQMPAKAQSGRSSFNANQTTSFFFVSEFGSGAYSAKLLNGTKHRLSGFIQARQFGEEVLPAGSSGRRNTGVKSLCRGRSAGRSSRPTPGRRVMRLAASVR